MTRAALSACALVALASACPVYAPTEGNAVAVGVGGGGGSGGGGGAGGGAATGWTFRIHGKGTQRISAVRVTPDGGALAAGSFDGEIALGSAMPVTGLGAFLVKLDGTGKVAWSKISSAMSSSAVTDIAVAPGGHIALTGYFKDGLDFGAKLTGTKAGVFVTRLDAMGGHVWSERLADSGAQPELCSGTTPPSSAYARVALTPDGSAIVAATVTGSVTVGMQTFTALGDNDVFVGRMNAKAGGLVWGAIYGDAVSQTVTAMTARPDGNVIIAGNYSGKMTIGKALTASSGGAAYAAEITADGAPVWARDLGEATGFTGSTADAANVWLGGCKTTAMASPGDTARLLVLDTSGMTSAELVAQGMGGTLRAFSSGVIGNGGVFLAGWVDAATSFGGPSLAVSGLTAFIASAKAATVNTVVALPSKGSSFVKSIDRFVGGDLLVGGVFDGELTVAGQTVDSDGDPDAIVARVSAPSP